MQFAVDVLKVKHIIVCGHYGCSGVKAALSGERLGISDYWIHHVHDVSEKHHAVLKDLKDASQRCDRLCELNVIEQVANVCQTAIVRDAWKRGQEVVVHGWIYALTDGLLRDLKITVASQQDADKAYESAMSALR